MRESMRLHKELEDLQNCSDNVSAKMAPGDDIRHWRGTIEGPKDTPYEGGLFKIDIEFPPDYPYVAPKMQFITRIWHPNISSQTGAICLDILKNEWSPALSVRTALLSIQALLSAPEPDDPQDAQVATMFKNDRDLFERTARMWTANFAKRDADRKAKIARFAEMGFSEDAAEAALEAHDGDEEAALNQLLA